MHRIKVLSVLLVTVYIMGVLVGCGGADVGTTTGWETPQQGITPDDTGVSPDTSVPVTFPVEQGDGEAVPDITEAPDISAEVGETPDGAGEGTDAEYLKVDMTLGRPTSSLYTYTFMPNAGQYRSITPSQKYDGFLEAKTVDNKEVLLTPELKEVKFPVGFDWKILEPFLFEGKVYFRVEDLETEWAEIPEVYSEQWWKPLGGYAVIDTDGKEVIPFGRFDYIDRFVEGKSRVYSVKDKNYYIIDAKGEILKTYPVEERIAPFKLFPDGYIYTRSDVDGKHSHALVTWDGEVVIPYYVYKDDIFPKYIGDDTFLVNNGVLADGSLSGLVLYSVGKEPRKLSKESYDVFSADEGKYVTGVITNGLAGPLAKWEYVVTDYAGKVLIERGKYTFPLGGWGGGYAVARNKDNEWVLLDNNCQEVRLPEHIKLTGRYSMDAALFTVKITKDFEMWRYADVPARYDNPVGVVDKDFHWVIPPGTLEYIRNLPVSSVNMLCEYKQGDDTDKGSLLLITPLK